MSTRRDTSSPTSCTCCTHCGLYEAHDDRGWCRRCICAHVSDPARFERLRVPQWFRVVWSIVSALAGLATGCKGQRT